MRWTRTVAYALLGGSGSLSMASGILAERYAPIAVYMAAFLIVGGFLCSLGSAFDRWYGEFMGLPLLSASFAVFSVLSFRSNVADEPLFAGATCALLLAVSLMMIARWRLVLAVYHFVMHVSGKVEGRE
jgi:hypothetical protein